MGPKRIISLILAAIMVLMVLGACSQSETARDVSGTETEAAEVSDAETETARDADKKSGKSVYFAGPLFSQSEIDYNLKITKVLEDHGYTVFLPQRDGLLASELEGKSEEELTDMIFTLDHEQVMKNDILFMNLDGRVPDEGACVELGMAYAAGKRCYGFKTDTRSIELGMDLNPMIAGCMTKIFKNHDGDKMIEELEQYLSENDL